MKYVYWFKLCYYNDVVDNHKYFPVQCLKNSVSDFLALQIITSKGPESLFLEIDVDSDFFLHNCIREIFC
jgi:cephalosporin hydroxylase